MSKTNNVDLLKETNPSSLDHVMEEETLQVIKGCKILAISLLALSVTTIGASIILIIRAVANLF
jgi:hypothetical protein